MNVFNWWKFFVERGGIVKVFLFNKIVSIYIVEYVLVDIKLERFFCFMELN